MQKTVILPGMWGNIDSDELDEEQMSYGVVTHRPSYKHVTFSGSTSSADDIEAQLREILSYKQNAIADLGGSMDDITVLRAFVREEALSWETKARMHEVRAEFFEYPHYPASTTVGVTELLHDDALIELEIEAEIPDDGWETEVLTDEE